jgi:peptidyl-dipeptidase Dcp
LLTRVRNVFSNLTSAHKNDALQNIETELAPLQAAHSDNILLNRRLYERVAKLWDSRESLKLNGEQAEVLKQHYESFVRAGAKLNDEQQARIRSLNEQLSKLETKFEENLLAISKERAVVVEDVAELDGMDAADIAAAAEGAKERGLEGKYLLEITNTTRVPVLSSLNNRSLRKRVWEATTAR